jgi:hypothetical protein
MSDYVSPKYTFETELPEGWYLGRLYKNRRVLHYKNCKVKSIFDDFNIERTVRDIIAHPPVLVEMMLFQDKQLDAHELSKEAQDRLLKKGLVTIEYAKKNFSIYSANQVPKIAEYDGRLYVNKNHDWYDEAGNCINKKKRFISTWEARVAYAQGQCTLTDVARYSWAAVLECLGDMHQRGVNSYLMPKLKLNKKAWTYDAKYDKQKRLDRNKKNEHTPWDETADIEEIYRREVNSCLLHHFTASVENHVMMFTKDCNIPAFDDMKKRTEKVENEVITELSGIERELNSFRWNSLMNWLEPVFAPKAMNDKRKFEFFNLVHDVLIGKISGHYAALSFSSGTPEQLFEEEDRYKRTILQHVPFLANMSKDITPSKISFVDAVNYIKARYQDMVRLGFRPADKCITSFNYDNCRFALHIYTGEVKYVGPLRGKYIPDSWLDLTPEERRKRLKDDQEWEYQEKSIKRYNRLFSYLFNVIYKCWDRATAYLEARKKARTKYLRLSSGFFERMQKKAEGYINSMERGVVTC